MAAGEIRAMTGVRGVAAVFVMIYHLELNRISAEGPFSIFLNHGYLSVDLFFVLSGFVLAHVYGPPVVSGTYRFSEFLWHRIARIYPLYIVLTVAFLALALIKSQAAEFSPEVLISNFVLLQSLGNWPSIDPPAWSVSAEMVAYLLFPLIALLCLKSGRTTAILAGFAACLAILVMTLAASWHYIGTPIAKGPLDIIVSPFTLIRCLAGFTIGQLLWRVHADPRVVSVASRTPVQAVVAILTLAALTQQDSDLVDYLMIVVLILCLSTDRGVLADFFASPPLHFLGVVSFAIYLTHYRAFGVWGLAERVFGAFDPMIRNTAATVVTALVVIAVSWLLHIMVEKPCRRWMRRGLPAIAGKPAA